MKKKEEKELNYESGKVEVGQKETNLEVTELGGK